MTYAPDSFSQIPSALEVGGPRYRAPALEKGLDVLELLAAHDRAMTATQISVSLERSMSELFRMIQVLEYRGYIEPSETGDGYELSNKLFSLAMARSPTRSLMEAALPAMRALTAAVGQSCHLGVASGAEVVVVARVENPGCYGFSVRPGFRRSLIDSTTGAVLFAFQSQITRQTWRDRLESQRPAAAVEAFVARCDAIRERGHERVRSRVAEGVVDLSAPILAGANALAGLTIPFLHGEDQRMDPDQALALLLETAGEISAAVNAPLPPTDI